MMTSVTLPSTSGSIHGVFPSSVSKESACSESEFETASRSVKRSLAASTPLVDSCKKRRKQSTPVRISATESETTTAEGKSLNTTGEHDHETDVKCTVCQSHFVNADQLQSHILSEHASIECKKEQEETLGTPDLEAENEGEIEAPLELTSATRSDMQWMSDLQKQEWMGANLHSLPFNPSNPMFMGLPQFAQPENLPRQPIRIFNPDAYCDLCNKEFCNKYFLKTHKANKHGIYTDPPSSDTNPVNIPTYSNVKLSSSVPTLDISTVKSEPQTATSITNPFSDIFSNPFSSKIFPKANRPNVSGLFEGEQTETVPTSNGFSSNNENDRITTDHPEESSSPRNLNTQAESTSFKTEPDGVPYTSPGKMSPGQRELDYSNRLRRYGVMNPKAFCEICCKEYCNKYFLRTHKLKRHGIYIPDEKDKDYKPDAHGNFPWQQNMQTSPLNLIMTEQNDRKTTSPADISCELCGIRFQNSSLAHLHNVSVHSKLYAKESEQLDSNNEEPKNAEGSNNVTEKSLNTENISEDLQKLQTMILQLNDLDVTKVPTSCSTCNREFENRYYLHAHMMMEHGVLVDEASEPEKPTESENSSNNNTLCDLCGKDIQNVEEMKKHMLEYHSNQQPSTEANKDDYNGFNNSDKGVSRVAISSGQIAERRMCMSLTPTSSYCEICNKELCNKYFMKTHMQRMHGIEIENGAQIGGVICDICNKELCSKYFLRVHKHNTHGIVEYGSSLLPPRKSENDPPPLIPPEPDQALKPVDLADLSHRYFTHFTEVCTICSRRFRSTKWLKAHLLSDHGQAGAEKWAELEQQLQHTIGQQLKLPTQPKMERASPTLKIPNGGQDNNTKLGIQNVLSSLFGVDESNTKKYQCSFCPFTTPLLPLLFVHERSHPVQTGEGENVPSKCPVCPQTFLQTELLQHHMFSQHPFLQLPSYTSEVGERDIHGDTPKELSESAEEDSKGDDGSTSASADTSKQPSSTNKLKKVKNKLKKIELSVSSDIGQSLQEVAKRTQLPATYALPQGCAGKEEGEASPMAGYVMQSFLLEESSAEKRIVPAVVFLPVLQKQPSPLTLTFTLTPA